MWIPPRRRLQYEKVPADPRASFACRSFRWKAIPFYWHFHPEFELAYLLKGRGLRFVGDSVQAFREGDLCFLGAHLPHTWYTRPEDGPARSLCIQFRPDAWSAPFLALPELRGLGRLFQRARRGLLVSGRTRAAAARLIQALARQPEGSLDRFLSLLGILNLLARSRECAPLSASAFDSPTPQPTHRKLAQVFRLISESDETLPAQAEAARHVRLSPQAFSRFFRRCLGKTYVAYLNELRIGRACRALLETSDGITEIAFAAGFENLSNFNRRFRILKGMAPRAYRRQAPGGLGAGEPGD